jgi:hypothetical protein
MPLSLLALCACGPKLPPRYVIEKDLGAYQYRRYQQVLDVEVPIQGNPAVGYTATYVRGGQTLALAPVFVTVYKHARGLSETVRARLRAMMTYTFDVIELEGAYMFRVRGDGGDTWVLWVSGPQLVKLGVPEGDKQVPEDVVKAYLEKYPSDLDEKGHPDDDAESAGPASEASEAGDGKKPE